MLEQKIRTIKKTKKIYELIKGSTASHLKKAIAEIWATQHSFCWIGMYVDESMCTNGVLNDVQQFKPLPNVGYLDYSQFLDIISNFLVDRLNHSNIL